MREYVEKMLHANIKVDALDASRTPLYLKGLYSLKRWTVSGVPFAIAVPHESSTVKNMAKHRDALEAVLGMSVAFALEKATNYRVGRMIEAGLAFIVLGKQVYLPFLGIALNERADHLSVSRRVNVETFSPQAQRLALMAIYGGLDGVSVTRVAGLLGVTKMTSSRAFDELSVADPSIVAAKGRCRLLCPDKDKLALWQRLEPYMSNPVARDYRLDHIPDASLPFGGISALCEVSMLQDNPWPTFTATRAQERTLGLEASACPVVLTESENPTCVVQVMRYEPVLAPGYAVDPLSAILSLTDDDRSDPRIAGEIERVLNQVIGGADEGNR